MSWFKSEESKVEKLEAKMRNIFRLIMNSLNDKNYRDRFEIRLDKVILPGSTEEQKTDEERLEDVLNAIDYLGQRKNFFERERNEYLQEHSYQKKEISDLLKKIEELEEEVGRQKRFINDEKRKYEDYNKELGRVNIFINEKGEFLRVFQSCKREVNIMIGGGWREYGSDIITYNLMGDLRKYRLDFTFYEDSDFKDVLTPAEIITFTNTLKERMR